MKIGIAYVHYSSVKTTQLKSVISEHCQSHATSHRTPARNRLDTLVKLNVVHRTPGRAQPRRGSPQLPRRDYNKICHMALHRDDVVVLGLGQRTKKRHRGEISRNPTREPAIVVEVAARPVPARDNQVKVYRITISAPQTTCCRLPR